VENSQLKKLKPWESEQKPSQPSIPKSPPEDWAAWLESSEPAVKEKYNEVYDRLSKFISPEQALKKAYQRAWEFSSKTQGKPA
jgi:hypothetical protein